MFQAEKYLRRVILTKDTLYNCETGEEEILEDVREYFNYYEIPYFLKERLSNDVASSYSNL